MSLRPNQQRHLRSLAHHLRPVVLVGQQGLRDSVYAEIDAALRAHELIKVRVAGEDRGERADLIDAIRERMGADLVQRIGHVAVLFRRNPDKPRIELPDA